MTAGKSGWQLCGERASLRGRFRGYSTERLMRMLTAFDQDIEITVRPRRGKSKAAERIMFTAATA